jgi:hypothetical protein
VRTRQQRQANGVGIFLQHCFSDLLWRLVKTGINDLKTMVTQGTGNRLGPSVMAV